MIDILPELRKSFFPRKIQVLFSHPVLKKEKGCTQRKLNCFTTILVSMFKKLKFDIKSKADLFLRFNVIRQMHLRMEGAFVNIIFNASQIQLEKKSARS